MIEAIQVSDPRKIAEAIAHLSRGGDDCGGLLAVFRAVYAKRIACTMVADPKIPIGDIPLDARRPLLVIVGDDSDSPCGPTGWRSARGLIGWSKATIIHVAAASQETYSAAVALAELYHRALLVETTSTHAPAWAELVKPGTPGCLVWPRGGVHPVGPNRSAMQ